MNLAIAYLRTSSAANVEGDSAHRQNKAIAGFAIASGCQVNSCFWDAAVSGADPIETRAGFIALLNHAEAAGIDLVLVEDASRFARSMIAQELGVMLLAQRGIRLVTASGLELTDETDPARVMMRQVAGAFAQYEKTKLVEKLRAGRQRVRIATGRCEGRKSHNDLNPDISRQARRLARRNPKTGKTRSLRQIANELAMLGFRTSSGGPLCPTTVSGLLRK